MNEDEVPLLLFSPKSTIVARVGRRLGMIGRAVLKVQPDLPGVLSKLGIRIEPEVYVVASLLSAATYGIVFAILAFLVLTVRENLDAGRISLAIALSFTTVFLLLHLIYPKIVLRKVAAKESKDLLFALREITINLDSGIPLFDAMKNIGEGNYGYVSKDFESVVRQIDSGTSEREALRALALKTESEYMKRAVWQMVNALESGASMNTALPGIIQAIESYVYREIRDYSSNLNFLMLIYMMIAAVLPTLGITFLVLLSAFSGLGVTMNTVAVLITISAIGQTILIGFMASTRPEIFGG
ncbi:type II secretion system F family protein [Candidatus Micrarchaeota archaeon]|nr:type II secretion system F family protein [Candidatus Micrarchaeota archaeon]